MHLTDKQAFVLADANARMNLLDGAIRSGKTVGLNARWIKYIMRMDKHDWQGDGILSIVGVTAQSIYRNIIQPMEEHYGEAIKYTPSQQKVRMFGIDCIVFGAKDEGCHKALRGMTGGGWLADELTLINKTFLMELIGRQSAKGAKGFAGTNPDNPRHHVKTDFIDKRDKIKMNYYKFTLNDNPNLDPDYVEDIKLKYHGVWRQRMIDGLWVAAEGMIYPFFEESEPFVLNEPPEDAARYCISIDYGIQNPTVFLLFGESNRQDFSHGKPRYWCEDEYYYSGRETGIQKTDEQLADDLEDFINRKPDIRRKLYTIFIDPSAASFIATCKRRGLPVKPANNAVLDGIRAQASVLVSGEYAIIKKCTHTIEEYFLYRWDEKAALRGEDKPIKDSDHCQDSQRYYILTRWGLNGGLQFKKMNIL